MLPTLKSIGLSVLKVVVLPLVVLLSAVFAVWLAVISVGLFVRKQILMFAAKKRDEHQGCDG